MLERARSTLYEKFEYSPESEVSVDVHESQGEEFKTYTYTPENPVSEIPVVYSWGFATNNYVVSEFADKLAQQGRIVTVVDEPNRYSIGEEEQEGYKYVARNADFVESAIEGLNYDEVDFVAHSQGSIISRLVAKRREEQVRSIVEMAPAGQDGKGGKLRQNWGGFVEGLRMAGKVFRKSTIRGIGRQLVHNTVNIKQSLGQQTEIAGGNERQSNLDLRANDVKLGLVAMHADAIYKPQHLMDEQVLDNNSPGRYDAVASFRRPMATHNEMFDNSGETAVAVSQMLGGLNGEEVPIVERQLTNKEIRRERMRVKAAILFSKLLGNARKQEELAS